MNDIYGIILAAGEGRRANGNKLSKAIGPMPMLEWVIRAAVQSDLKQVVVVTGQEKSFAEDLAQKYGLLTVHNKDYRTGMTSSLQCGVRSLPDNIDGFAVLLGDMPFITSNTINTILRSFDPQGIVIPAYKGKKGHPPLYAIKFKQNILNISGDIGAREVMIKNERHVSVVSIDDEGILKDIDYF